MKKKKDPKGGLLTDSSQTNVVAEISVKCKVNNGDEKTGVLFVPPKSYSLLSFNSAKRNQTFDLMKDRVKRKKSSPSDIQIQTENDTWVFSFENTCYVEMIMDLSYPQSFKQAPQATFPDRSPYLTLVELPEERTSSPGSSAGLNPLGIVDNNNRKLKHYLEYRFPTMQVLKIFSALQKLSKLEEKECISQSESYSELFATVDEKVFQKIKTRQKPSKYRSISEKFQAMLNSSYSTVQNCIPQIQVTKNEKEFPLTTVVGSKLTLFFRCGDFGSKTAYLLGLGLQSQIKDFIKHGVQIIGFGYGDAQALSLWKARTNWESPMYVFPTEKVLSSRLKSLFFVEGDSHGVPNSIELVHSDLGSLFLSKSTPNASNTTKAFQGLWQAIREYLSRNSAFWTFFLPYKWPYRSADADAFQAVEVSALSRRITGLPTLPTTTQIIKEFEAVVYGSSKKSMTKSRLFLLSDSLIVAAESKKELLYVRTIPISANTTCIPHDPATSWLCQHEHEASLLKGHQRKKIVSKKPSVGGSATISGKDSSDSILNQRGSKERFLRSDGLHQFAATAAKSRDSRSGSVDVGSGETEDIRLQILSQQGQDTSSETSPRLIVSGPEDEEKGLASSSSSNVRSPSSKRKKKSSLSPAGHGRIESLSEECLDGFDGTFSESPKKSQRSNDRRDKTSGSRGNISQRLPNLSGKGKKGDPRGSILYGSAPSESSRSRREPEPTGNPVALTPGPKGDENTTGSSGSHIPSDEEAKTEDQVLFETIHHKRTSGSDNHSVSLTDFLKERDSGSDSQLLKSSDSIWRIHDPSAIYPLLLFSTDKSKLDKFNSQLNTVTTQLQQPKLDVLPGGQILSIYTSNKLSCPQMGQIRAWVAQAFEVDLSIIDLASTEDHLPDGFSITRSKITFDLQAIQESTAQLSKIGFRAFATYISKTTDVSYANALETILGFVGTIALTDAKMGYQLSNKVTFTRNEHFVLHSKIIVTQEFQFEPLNTSQGPTLCRKNPKLIFNDVCPFPGGNYQTYLSFSTLYGPIAVIHERHDSPGALQTFVYTPQGFSVLCLPWYKSREKSLDNILSLLMPDRKHKLAFSEVSTQSFMPSFIEHLQESILKQFKFGVLASDSKSDVCQEEDLYETDCMSPDFVEFLECLGVKTKVGGTEYAGGLTDAEYFYSTKFCGNDIAYHVCPLIQSQPDDPSRKRHIGNDVSVIIFQENPEQVIDIPSFRSKFNHIFVIVKKHTIRKQTMYQVDIVAKAGVQHFPPALDPGENLFTKATLRKFLLTKLINAERHGIEQLGSFATSRAKLRWNSAVKLFRNFGVDAQFCNVFGGLANY